MAIVMVGVRADAYFDALGLYKIKGKHRDMLSEVGELRNKAARAMWDAVEYSEDREQALVTFLQDDVKFRLAYDGTTPVAGYMVLHGELLGLFSEAPGLGGWLMSHVNSDGAWRLDCFDGYLPKFYKRHGWYEHRRIPNHTKGGPDVVYMRQYTRNQQAGVKGREEE